MTGEFEGPPGRDGSTFIMLRNIIDLYIFFAISLRCRVNILTMLLNIIDLHIIFALSLRCHINKLTMLRNIIDLHIILAILI